MNIENGEWKLVFADGKPVAEGMEVPDFRGALSIVEGGYPPAREGSTGRVVVTDGEFYPSVYGMKWVRK